MAFSHPLRLGLVVPPISGHLNPALSVARELARRGHEIIGFGLPDAAGRVTGCGFGFQGIGLDRCPPGTVAAWMRIQGEKTGLGAMKWILRCLQQENLAYLRDLPDALLATGVDGLLVDQISYGAASVAQHLGLPYVTLCNALPVHADSSVPPFATAWRPLSSALERFRSKASQFILRPLFAAHFAPLDARRREWGLPPLQPGTLADSPLAILSQQPPAFEFPGRVLPPHFHLTGPWIRDESRPSEPFPFDRLDGRPLIYASMGTLQNRLDGVFRTIASACTGFDAQLVVSLGRHDAGLLAGLPGNPVVVPFAPQLRLMRLASVVVTHAGLNTTLEALAHGVPLVGIPVANDQPGVAARIRAAGVGEFVSLNRLSVPRLRRRIEQVLFQPRYQEAARRMAKAIAIRDGAGCAADHIESVLGSRQSLSYAIHPSRPARVPELEIGGRVP